MEHLALTKAHRRVEGAHRAAAWRVLLRYVKGPQQAAVIAAMDEALQAWLAFRDDVAAACGVTRAADGGVSCAA